MVDPFADRRLAGRWWAGREVGEGFRVSGANSSIPLSSGTPRSQPGHPARDVLNRHDVTGSGPSSLGARPDPQRRGSSKQAGGGGVGAEDLRDSWGAAGVESAVQGGADESATDPPTANNPPIRPPTNLKAHALREFPGPVRGRGPPHRLLP